MDLDIMPFFGLCNCALRCLLLKRPNHILEVTTKFVRVPAHKFSVAPDSDILAYADDDTYVDDSDVEYEQEGVDEPWTLRAGEEEGMGFEEYCDKMWQ